MAKYQIFVSSTYIDLVKEREKAVEAILKLGHIPAGMELFSAGKSQWETITEWIDDSDIYILILGGRYGSIDPETGKSYTQLEYEYALENDIPMFAVVLDDKFINQKVLDGEKNGDPEENFREIKNKEKYEQFKKLVTDKKLVDFAKDISDITSGVLTNIFATINEYQDDLRGWSRESISAIELIRKNKELLEENEKLKNPRYQNGMTYEDMKKILESKKLILEDNKERNFIEIFILCYNNITVRKINSKINPKTSKPTVLYSNFIPELVSLKLCELKVPSLSFEPYKFAQFTEDGSKFLFQLLSDKSVDKNYE